MAHSTMAIRFSMSVCRPVECEEIPGLAEEGVELIASSSTGVVAGRAEMGAEGIVSSSHGFVAGLNEAGVVSIVRSSAGFVAGVTDEGVGSIVSSSQGCVAGLAEDVGVDSIDSSSDGFVAWHVPVRLDTVLEAVRLPYGIFNLESSLADVGADSLALFR